VTPSKSFASVLASSVCLELACCGETALVFVSDARSMPDVPPVGALAPSTRSTADEMLPPAWPWLPRLLLRRRGGDGTSSNVVLPPRGEDVIDSAADGRIVGCHCRCRAAGEGVSCRSCRRGTLTQDSRNGAPSRAGKVAGDYPGGSLDRRVNCRCVPQPRWVGTRQSAKGGRSRRETGVKEETRGLRVCPAPGSGALAVGGYKRPRGREREAYASAVPSFPARPTLSKEGPGPSFYRRKERIQVYNGGCSSVLTCLAEKS
jgi:hypothetical protein